MADMKKVYVYENWSGPDREKIGVLYIDGEKVA